MKKIHISNLLLAALLLTGCNDKESFRNDTQSGEPVLTTFKISSPKSYADGLSEPGTDQENQIKTLEFYLFNADGIRDDRTDATDYSYYKHEGDGTSAVTFLVRAGENKKVLVAVNTNVGQQPDLGYDDVEKIIEQAMLDNSNSQVIEAGKFIMSGKKTATIQAENQNNEVTMQVSRLAVKIEAPLMSPDLKVNIPDSDLRKIFTDQTVTAENVSFMLDNYVLINGYSKSHVQTYYNDTDDETTNWSKWAPNGKHMKTLFTAEGDVQQAYSGMEGSSVWLKETEKIFAYENQPRTTTSTETGRDGYVQDEVYAFLIKGRLINANDNQALTRYWRINLIRDDNYKIFRNTIYRVTLYEVTSTGYGTPKEAEEDKDNGGGDIVPKDDYTGIQVNIDIIDWRVKTQNAEF